MAAPLASVRAYSGGGFNMNNIPRSVGVLESNSTINDLEVINCLPVSGRSKVEITVKPFANLSRIDYIRIIGSDNVAWYGIVNGYQYVSMTSVVISATLDGWLTCVAAGITSISGYLTRHTTADDELFKYTEEDPLLVPSKPLDFESTIMFPTTGDTSLIESTINLVEMGKETYKISRTFDTDGDVVVPLAVKSPTSSVVLRNAQGGTKDSNYIGRGFYSPTDKTNDGITNARSLGYENGILGSYKVPTNMILTTAGEDEGFIASIEGMNDVSYAQNFVRPQQSTVMNNRLWAGQANSYVLWSPASGEQVMFKPEDLYEAGLSRPEVRMVADPRSKGKPFFMFSTGSHKIQDGINQMIAGAKWDNLPLNYQESSGQGLKERIFSAEQKIKLSEFESSQKETALQTLAGVGMGLGSAVAGGMTGNVALFASGILGAAGATSGLHGIMSAGDDFNRDRALEKAKFVASTYSVPQIVSPPDADAIRDIYGNCCYVGKFRYSAFDLDRLDRILNMFGYKDNKVLEMSDLTVGRYCTYLECSDVTIVSNAPRFAEEICAKQLSAGVRLWARKPDSSVFGTANR